MRLFHLTSLGLLLLIPVSLMARKKEKLFNKKKHNEWYAFEEKSGRHINAAGSFSVDRKMIRLYGPHAGYLMTNRSFSNFQLTAKFRWNTDRSFVRKNTSKNSGLMYLVPREVTDTLWPKGIQFQIKEGACGDFILLQGTTLNVQGKIQGQGRSVVVKRIADAEKPAGSWNTLQIRVKDGTVEQILNGTLVNKGSISTPKEGRILLQYEGFPIDFKNIEISLFSKD